MVQLSTILGLSLVLSAVTAAPFNPLQWLGANGQWYPGPDVSGVSQELPDGCAVDQVTIVSRHGSRYPDPGAYNEWLALEAKVKNGSFSGPLGFFNDWHPILTHPSDQVAQLSVTGYLETYALGTQTRLRYPHLYADNTAFVVWANNAQRTTDSARLFARGFGGPNATTLGTVYVVNPKGAQAGGNSLATSDLCPKYVDTSGANQTAIWDSIYLPPILKRLQKYIKGVNITTSDISIMPYLCGFETQITGKLSPFCDIFTESEFKQYEYRQDLRYYYGTGPGTDLPSTLMLPYLNATATLFLNGPGYTYSTGFTPPPIIVSYTHDNQLNEIATAIGVFDTTGPLPPNKIQNNRLFISSRINPMAGRIAFERMACTSKKPGIYVRIRVNDAVYPMSECQSGPGKTCPLAQFGQVIKAKVDKAGDFMTRQNVADGTGTDQIPRHNTALIRSPYFENSKTPRRRRPVRSDGEETEEDKRANTQLKRRRLILRGVMPDEFSSPSSPEELSRALRAIKPTLIQESVCDDPWKIIIATTLLNKTKGKATVPVFWELIERWPTPTALAQVAAPSLTELLRPLGTQSIRTSRLMRLSNAYVMHPPNLPSPPAPTSRTTKFYPGTTKEYRAIQQTSPIAHLPFVGPYAIDSFRIFSPALSGGGAGARVKEQLGRIACLAELGQSSRSEDDFDETPDWYNPSSLCSPDDEGEEWRNVWPEDKQLRRYLVWRWAIDGVEYNPEARIRHPADWSYLNRLIRG
ncbi:histidine acid phosphatase family [Rhizoctonia solani]|uniref:Histidine acid phosphatase family n=1 Tax=Rhizoctonia solani TaxID=456999 RepID=A0A8H7HDQ6_9AGAM|nr:histidine acid phosphatase family [Rhizoctonia solani]